MNSVTSLKTLKGNTQSKVAAELSRTGGLLRLAPTWVPRSFLQPGLRIKLHPDDTYAYGANRGGIDERWFASTTEAANEGRVPGRRPELLRRRQGALHPAPGGGRLRRRHRRQGHLEEVRHAGRSTRSSSTTWGRFRTTCTRAAKQAKLVGQEGKPESYYFPPQHNNVGNNFPYTFFGLEPGTTKAQVRKCLEDWNKGDNGILDLSKAYRLKPGTGWLVGPCILHAPGSLCTYEPQWGSDVFGMYQTLVEGRDVPWSLLVKDVPKKQAPGPRLHRRPARLGGERRSAASRTTTTSNPFPWPTRATKASSIAGSSMARWTASSSSPPRN